MIRKNLISNEDSIPVVITTDKTANSILKGYHALKGLWKAFINEELTTAMEPDNVVDKYTLCLKKNNVIVGHLPHSKNGRFTKMIFYFLREDKHVEWKVIIIGKEVNLGDGKRMKVPFSLKISGTKNMLQIICKNIQN